MIAPRLLVPGLTVLVVALFLCPAGSSDGALVPGASLRPAPSTSAWTQLALTVHPPGLEGAGMTYDPAGKLVVLFGGVENSSGTWVTTNATWEYSGGVWTKVHPRVAPSPRAGVYLAWDAFDRYLVLFGGTSSIQSCCHYLNDTWKFSNGSWTKLRPQTAPEPRAYGQVAYYPAIHSVFTLDGVGGPNGAYGNDSNIWAFSGGNWMKLGRDQWGAALGSLGPYPPGHDLVHVGCGAPGFFTEIYRGGHWIQLKYQSATLGPCDDPFVWDPLYNASLLFDGGSGQNVSTWVFQRGTWSSLGAANSPPFGGQAVAVYDVADRYVLEFGGATNYCGTTGRAGNSACLLNETWVLR
ncbi:MAG TPA: kelch repeat-containing protein [Thermoplasmata archaeon]|nr:kelch repeat-containing protein [Thermoplasmata archaeon]